MSARRSLKTFVLGLQIVTFMMLVTWAYARFTIDGKLRVMLMVYGHPLVWMVNHPPGARPHQAAESGLAYRLTVYSPRGYVGHIIRFGVFIPADPSQPNRDLMAWQTIRVLESWWFFGGTALIGFFCGLPLALIRWTRHGWHLVVRVLFVARTKIGLFAAWATRAREVVVPRQGVAIGFGAMGLVAVLGGVTTVPIFLRSSSSWILMSTMAIVFGTTWLLIALRIRDQVSESQIRAAHLILIFSLEFAVVASLTHVLDEATRFIIMVIAAMLVMPIYELTYRWIIKPSCLSKRSGVITGAEAIHPLLPTSAFGPN